ncbi:hypothetical protein QFC22_001655 [Naganishia vaughanmartiniae]|uniref:Uncharacterized protein n=1 Tax=Naganishia vaughanmartiniae TaxID=1424756 RepID=A0ACC2XFS7_9TREE|nr:hypothetical protein QFC22_001655 [Naganishia vaughanmartiniae]
MSTSEVESDEENPSQPPIVALSSFAENGDLLADCDSRTIVVRTEWMRAPSSRDEHWSNTWIATHSIEFTGDLTPESIYREPSGTEDPKTLDEEAQCLPQLSRELWIGSFEELGSKWVALAVVFHAYRKSHGQVCFSYTWRNVDVPIYTMAPTASAPHEPQTQRIQINYSGRVKDKVNSYIQETAEDSRVKLAARDVLMSHVEPDLLRLALIANVFARNLVCGPFEKVLNDSDFEIM